MNKNLNEFPVYAAALLKYKKHQWMILGFAENKKVKLMWVNKGDNKKSVTLALSSQEMVKKAVNLKCDTVLRFHNHPNPRKHNLSRPGRYDKKTCQKYGDLLARNSINYLDFVCKEGLPYKFNEKYHETFIPREEFINNIKEMNGKSKSKNLKLHKERLST